MTVPKRNISEPISPELELGLLKAGYFDMFLRRYPLRSEISDCESDEEKLYLALEKKFMNIPDELVFDRLQDSIPRKHNERIAKVWHKVLETKFELTQSLAALLSHWEARKIPRMPPKLQKTVDDILRLSPVALHQGKFRKALATVAVPLDDKQVNGTGQLHMSDAAITPTDLDQQKVEKWKTTDKGHRSRFYEAHKNYLFIMRLYFELLLESEKEKQEDKTKKKVRSVLPLGHEARSQIATWLRYVRLLYACTQGISMAKACHHEQVKGRLRKDNSLPFIDHPASVLLQTVFDVAPFAIPQNGNIKIDGAVLGLVPAAHDLGEDTELTVDYIMKKYFSEVRVDRADSSLDQVGESGFGKSKDYMNEEVFNLIKARVRQDVTAALTVLSKKSEMSVKDNKKAITQNIAGRERTFRILLDAPYPLKFSEEAMTEDVRELHFARRRFHKLCARLLGITESSQIPFSKNEPDSKTFSEFAVSDSYAEHKAFQKMDAFLIAMKAHCGPKQGQMALITKLEDRAHNIETMEVLPPLTQVMTLRATVTRLLAWCALDHNREEYPLYNALPRLITVTLEAYRRILENESMRELVEDRDREYCARLQEWKEQFKPRKMPDWVFEMLKEPGQEILEEEEPEYFEARFLKAERSG